jgi:signal peptidase II
MMLIGVSMLVLALDQLAKFWVTRSLHLHESVALLPGTLHFTYIQNPGVAFGFMSGMETVVRIPFFVAITIAAGSIIWAYQRLLPQEKRLTRVALGFILGGALGNFIDRVLYGKVIDFIDMRYQGFHWYVFNVADACICVGLLFLLFDFIKDSRAKVPA